MQKSSPGARFVRTLLQALAGVAAGAALIDWTTNYKSGAVFVALGAIAAVLAASLAALQAVAGWTADTPLTKGLVTFAQLEAAGLATLAVNDWTGAAFIVFGQAFLRLTVGAVVAAVAAYAQNAAEDRVPIRA